MGSFLAVVECTGDVLLYCYAWNKKFKKENAENYCPEDLRAIVGFEDKVPESYEYYGNAPPNAYLSFWYSGAVKDPTTSANVNQSSSAKGAERRVSSKHSSVSVPPPQQGNPLRPDPYST